MNLRLESNWRDLCCCGLKRKCWDENNSSRSNFTNEVCHFLLLNLATIRARMERGGALREVHLRKYLPRFMNSNANWYMNRTTQEKKVPWKINLKSENLSKRSFSNKNNMDFQKVSNYSDIILTSGYWIDFACET